MESLANPAGPRPRYDSSSQLLTLPAPLALNRPATTSASSHSITRSSEDVYSDHSSSHHRLVPSRSSIATEPVEEHYGASGSTSPRHASPSRGNIDHQSARTANGYAAIRQVMAPTPFPGETTNPFQSGHDHHSAEHDTGSSASHSPLGGQPRVRGISLSDNGPVPGPDGVRRISRPSARRTSATPQQNRYSRSASIYASLPPGAAPPNPNNGHS